MADSADPAPPPEATPPPAETIIPAQLSQVRAPLDEAGVALSTPDSAGRLPIVILPEHPMRIRNELVVAGVVVLVIGIVFDLSFALRGGALGLGALLIVRPGTRAIDPAALLAIGTAAIWASSTILIKVMARTESAGAITTYMVLLTTPMTFLAALFVWQNPTIEQLGWAALLGTAGSIGHFCMSRALGTADATLVAPFDYLRLPIVALIAFLAFGEVPGVWVWIGGGVIAASSIYIAQREGRAKGLAPASPAPGGPSI